MDINELTQSQKDAILGHFREAIACRVSQWEHERQIEFILDEELDLDVSAWAVGFDCENPTAVTWEDFLNATL